MKNIIEIFAQGPQATLSANFRSLILAGIKRLKSLKNLIPGTAKIMFLDSNNLDKLKISIEEAEVFRRMSKLTDGELPEKFILEALAEYCIKTGLER